MVSLPHGIQRRKTSGRPDISELQQRNVRQRATVTPPSQVTVKSLPSPVSMMTQSSPGEEASPSPAPDVVMAAPPMVEPPPLLPLPLPPPGLEVDLEPSEEELEPEEPACAEPEMEVDWRTQMSTRSLRPWRQSPSPRRLSPSLKP